MRIGIDLHDTITYRPDLFKELIENFNDVGHTVVIISGTPAKDRDHVTQTLDDLEIPWTYISLGFDYEKDEMTHDHFLKMREWKLATCQRFKIDLYIDDNPYYVKYIAQHGILVLQPVLDDAYIQRFNEGDPYFTCNLQEKQFDFLEEFVLARK